LSALRFSNGSTAIDFSGIAVAAGAVACEETSGAVTNGCKKRKTSKAAAATASTTVIRMSLRPVRGVMDS